MRWVSYGGGSQMLAVSTDIRSDYVALGSFLPGASSEVLGFGGEGLVV